jgi:hypothetical protein
MKSEKRRYSDTWFASEVLREAATVFDTRTKIDPEDKTELYLSASSGPVERGHDDETEFYADYRKDPADSFVTRTTRRKTGPQPFLRFQAYGPSEGWSALATIEVHAENWPDILAVMDVFERAKEESQLPFDKSQAKDPKIFIGHGHSDAWKHLRDHLQDKHGFEIVAYEVGARAGHAIRVILDTMLAESTMAFLIMTGEDMTAAGELHPRLNVVHEAGLFQGRLGFHRAIVCLEEGVTEFSNMHGIEQIRFATIREAFGDIVATIRREFPHG